MKRVRYAIDLGYYDTKEEALRVARSYFGAVEEGAINIISLPSEGRYVENTPNEEEGEKQNAET